MAKSNFDSSATFILLYAAEKGDRNGAGYEGHCLREGDLNQVPRDQRVSTGERDRFREYLLHGGVSLGE
jgi:hypothetical protein